MENVKLSFENSRRFTALNGKMHEAINELMYTGLRESRKQVISDVNKAIFDMAEKQGVSIYDICFHFVPVESLSMQKLDEMEESLNASANITTEIKLVPIQFEFKKGPDYWEQKYYNLKEEMQKLIDSKD